MPTDLPDRDGQIISGLEPDFLESRLIGQPDRLAVFGRSMGHRVETRTDPVARNSKRRLLQIIWRKHHAADQRQVRMQHRRAAGHPADRQVAIGEPQRFQRDRDGVWRSADWRRFAASRMGRDEDEDADTKKPDTTECCVHIENQPATAVNI